MNACKYMDSCTRMLIQSQNTIFNKIGNSSEHIGNKYVQKYDICIYYICMYVVICTLHVMQVEWNKRFRFRYVVYCVRIAHFQVSTAYLIRRLSNVLHK